MPLLDEEAPYGRRTVTGAPPPPVTPRPRLPAPQQIRINQAPAPPVVQFDRALPRWATEDRRTYIKAKQQQTELQRRQAVAYNYDNPAVRQGIIGAVEANIPQAVQTGQSLLASKIQEQRRRQGGYQPTDRYADPATAAYARTLGHAQPGSGGLPNRLGQLPGAVADAYNRIPDRVQNALPGPIGAVETFRDTVPGFPAIQRGAQKVVNTVGIGAPIGPFQEQRRKYGEEVIKAIIPTKAWEVALTLAPAAKATTVGELISAVALGDADAVSAIKAGAKRAGLTNEAVERGIRTLQSEQGSLRLFGKGKETEEVAKRIVLPREVKDVLRMRGVNVNKAERSWQLLPEVNRTFIQDMANVSVTPDKRATLLAEGRAQQAQAIEDAFNADLPIGDTVARAKADMAGRILPEFEGIGRNYTPEQVKSLSDQIRDAKTTGLISKFQFLQAGDSFGRLLTGGKQLEPGEKKLLGRIFGPEFEAAIPASNKWDAWREFVGVAGAPQALVSTLDWSAILRQMAPMGWAHPTSYLKAISTIKKATMSEQGASDVMLQALNKPWISKAPFPEAEGLSYLDQAGRWADIGGHLHESEGQFSALNQSMASRAVEMLPWAKPSERAYNVPINVLRGEVYSKEAQRMWNSGERRPEMYKSLVDVVEHATGWGSFSTGEIAKGFNAFFSPRNLVARFQFLLDPITQPGSLLKASPRQLAARNLAGFTSGITALLGAMAVSGKMWADANGKPNPVHIELDPRSSDWGKGKIGNMRIDATGGFGSILRLAARLAPLAQGESPKIKTTTSGEVIPAKASQLVDDFIRGKMGIVPGQVWDALGMKGGEQFKENYGTREGRLKAAYHSLTPFFVQDVVEAYREQGLGAAAIAAPASFLGLGVNTYQPSDSATIAKKIQEIDPTIQIDDDGDFYVNDEKSFPQWQSTFSDVGFTPAEFAEFKNIGEMKSEYVKQVAPTMGGPQPEKDAADGFERFESVKLYRKGALDGLLEFWQAHPDFLLEATEAKKNSGGLSEDERKILQDAGYLQ